MYKLSVPASVRLFTEENIPHYLQTLRAIHADRVFLHGVGAVYSDKQSVTQALDMMKKIVPLLQAEGYEVGIWLNGLGHGGSLLPEHARNAAGLTRIRGLDGGEIEDSFCPMDPDFSRAYCELVRRTAEAHPDIIMLDDDYRLSVRGYGVGCACDRHLAELSRRMGEPVVREGLRDRIFSGGENPLRSEWLRLMRDTLEDFARELRKAADSVDDSIRMGICMCYDTWDLDGSDGIRLARIFAGKNEPFLRTIGAPYWTALHWNGYLNSVIEYNRMQTSWCRESGIEVFTEGDVCPRPRYRVPSAYLELYDMALLCAGEADGILKYMLDYGLNPRYETGYTDRHIHHAALRVQMAEMFAGKTGGGVDILEAMHKLEACDFGSQAPTADALNVFFFGRAQRMLSPNGIPSVYNAGRGPVAAFGANAAYLTQQDLCRGVLLDVEAARILEGRGIDAGLASSEAAGFASEEFLAQHTRIDHIEGPAFYRIACREGAAVDSVFQPGGSPASYRYENAAGQRFFVLAYSGYGSPLLDCRNYFCTYARQRQLQDALVWLGRAPLPACCAGNPMLYLLASRGDDGSMAVGLFNIYEDELLRAPVVLDRAYRSVKFAGCTGHLEGNCVVIDYIPPYSAAAFEVRD